MSFEHKKYGKSPCHNAAFYKIDKFYFSGGMAFEHKKYGKSPCPNAAIYKIDNFYISILKSCTLGLFHSLCSYPLNFLTTLSH